VRNAEGDWDATTWTASVDYQWTPDLLVYFATRRGYKAGTFNADIDPSSPFYLVDPETVTDFELGSKFDWSAGNVQNRTNFAAYYSQYEDIQRNVSTVVNGVISTLARNAAEARIQGVELTHSSFFGEAFEVNMMYAYTDAEFTKVEDPILNTASGGELSGVPTSKGALTLRYHLPLDAALGTASIGVTGNYTSRWNWVDTIGTEPYGFSPEKSTVDARADWRNVMSSNLDIGLFVKNATDERYAVGGVALNATVGTTNYIYNEPRTYGIDFRYSFGR
jgi:iron complex outermembrane receptor protein